MMMFIDGFMVMMTFMFLLFLVAITATVRVVGRSQFFLL